MSRIKMHMRNLMLCAAYPIILIPFLNRPLPWATFQDMVEGKRFRR